MSGEREKLRMILVMAAPFIKVEKYRIKAYFARKFVSSVLDIFSSRCLWEIQAEMAKDQWSKSRNVLLGTINTGGVAADMDMCMISKAE